jgi:hypothetical protein
MQMRHKPTWPVEASDLMIMTFIICLVMIMIAAIGAGLPIFRAIERGNDLQQETNELLWEQLDMMLMYEDPDVDYLAEPTYLPVQSGFTKDEHVCSVYKSEEVRKLCIDLDLHKARFAEMTAYWYGHMRGETKELRGRTQ